MEINFDKIKKVHFIGIGGIGVSAVARIMLAWGKEVSGSDRAKSEIIDELAKLGAKIFFEHNEANVEDGVDLVVYTIAVNKDNPELNKAIKLGIKTLSYPEILGVISQKKYTIAISGTHGKTTTTAMIGKILKDAELDPTIIVGSLMKEFNSNLVIGKSDYFVVEACEYRRSFLNLNPRIIVITNIDNDHLDYYKDIEEIEVAFKEFVSKLKEEDYLVCNKKDDKLKDIVKDVSCKVVDYSENDVSDLKLKVIGNHNLENAKAAISVSKILNIKYEIAINSLENFHGTWRRFEYKGKTKNGAIVYDDYAHHPTEIKATLSGARSLFKDKKITVVFQPHLYSRTKILIDEFAKSFKDADSVVVSDIYAAREIKDESVKAADLVNKINDYEKKEKAKYIGNFQKIKNYLNNLNSNDVIITMGAGDIYNISDDLIKID